MFRVFQDTIVDLEINFFRSGDKYPSNISDVDNMQVCSSRDVFRALY